MMVPRDSPQHPFGIEVVLPESKSIQRLRHLQVTTGTFSLAFRTSRCHWANSAWANSADRPCIANLNPAPGDVLSAAGVSRPLQHHGNQSNLGKSIRKPKYFYVQSFQICCSWDFKICTRACTTFTRCSCAALGNVVSYMFFYKHASSAIVNTAPFLNKKPWLSVIVWCPPPLESGKSPLKVDTKTQKNKHAWLMMKQFETKEGNLILLG